MSVDTLVALYSYLGITSVAFSNLSVVNINVSLVAVTIEWFPMHPSIPIDGDFGALLPYKTEQTDTQTLMQRPIIPPPIAP